jgi:hypothetical protein
MLWSISTSVVSIGSLSKCRPETSSTIANVWLRNRRRKQWRELIEFEHSVTDEKLRELEEAGIRARNARRR